jgi:hypothetical protein
LLRLAGSLGALENARAPASIFDRVRADAKAAARGGARAHDG